MRNTFLCRWGYVMLLACFAVKGQAQEVLPRDTVVRMDGNVRGQQARFPDSGAAFMESGIAGVSEEGERADSIRPRGLGGFRPCIPTARWRIIPQVFMAVIWDCGICTKGLMPV